MVLKFMKMSRFVLSHLSYMVKVEWFCEKGLFGTFFEIVIHDRLGMIRNFA